jgi:ubiquitin carboxyl-terminal hydrolase 9/24
MFLRKDDILQDRDAQKMTWITKFVEELKNDKWVLPALKQIREICQLFPEVIQCRD